MILVITVNTDINGLLIKNLSVSNGLCNTSRTVLYMIIFVAVVRLLCCVRLFATLWTTARQAPLSFTVSGRLLRFMSVELVMLTNHLILCHYLLLLPSIFPSIRVFSNESALRIRWPKYWCFSFNISPSNDQSFTQDWSPLGWTGWIPLLSKGLSRVFSNTTVQKHQFFGAQPSLWSNSPIHTWLQEKP